MTGNGANEGRLGHAWSHLVSLQAGQGASLLLGALSVAVVSRLLGPDRYGQLTLFLAVAQYAVILSINWTTASVVRFGRDEVLRESSMRKVFWTRLAIVVPCLVVVCAAVGLAKDRILGWSGLPARHLGWLMAMIAVLALADHFDGTLQAAGLWRRYAWLGALEKAVFVIGVGVAWATAGQGLLGMAIVMAIVAQLARIGLAATAIAGSGMAGSPGVDADTMRRILAYSWPQTLTYTVGYFSAFVEPFLIKRHFSVEDVGIYSVAYQTSLLAIALLGPLSTLLFPAVTSLRVQGREDVVVRLLTRVVPQLVFLLALLLVVAMGVASLAFEPLFGRAYAAGLAPLLILLSAIGFQVVTSFYSPVLAAYDLVKEQAVLNTVGGIVAHLLPLIVLVPLWGIRGAAASWLVWYVCSAAYSIKVLDGRLSTRTMGTLAAPAAGLAALAVFLFVQPLFWRWILVALLFAGSVAWARRRGLFEMQDLSIFEEAGVPAPLRRILGRVYRVLGH